MQEEVNEKTISLCIKGGKITAQILKAALIKLLAEMDKKKQRGKGEKSQCKKTGRQSIKSLQKSGAQITNIVVTDNNIKSFDRVARKYGIDYKCGTGHGVGFFLNVHEGPNGLRPKSLYGHEACIVPGMITTDEPGVYVPGKYGIRTENMLICKKWQQNEYGAFLHFEPLTLVPIDLDGVDLSLFNEKEKQLLTDYQQFVYDTLSPHLNEEESAWLHTLTL